jgi:hypothetical protein
MSNRPQDSLPEEDVEAYQRIGWNAWARFVQHNDCPYRDERRAPWQLGWRAAEQNYRKAKQMVDGQSTHLGPDLMQRVEEAAPLRDRAAAAALYRLNCSPHEWTDAESDAIARYVTAASWALEAIAARATGGATPGSRKCEYTRDEMRDACRNNYNAALEAACGALAAVAIEANRLECCGNAGGRIECCGNPNLLVTANKVAQAIRALKAAVREET